MKNPMSLFKKCRKGTAVWIICAGVCLSVLNGCHKRYTYNYYEENVTPETPDKVTLSLSVEDLVFEAKGGWQEFTIDCSGEWTVTGGNEWCLPGAVSGSGKAQMKVMVEAYTGTDDRNVILIVKAGELTQTLTVTQKSVNALILTKDKIEVPAEGNDISVEVKTNVECTPIVPSAFQTWIKEKPVSKAMETKNFRFKVTANEDSRQREGYIVIDGGELKDTVHIYQAYKTETGTEEKCLILSSKTYEVNAAGETLTVELKTNVVYEIIVPDNVSNWVSCLPETRALRTDKLQLVIEANSKTEERRAEVIVKDRNSELSDTLHIRQMAKEPEPETPAGNFDQTEYLLEDNAHSKTISFSVPAAWQVSVSYEEAISEWLSVSVTNGEAGLTNLSITTTANTTKKIRQAYIDVAYGNRSQRLTIRQDADITDEFDPVFAKSLADGKYIKTSTHITIEEVKTITSINMRVKNLTSLQGIEYLTELTYLDCYRNKLSSLDISKNTKLTYLDCSRNNYLSSLDISKNTELTYLDCGDNNLRFLDLSKNTKLTYLDCYENKLSSLDLSKNTELTDLTCSFNNMSSLDVSNNTKLIKLVCNGGGANILLSSLDVSKNTELTYLSCDNNDLISLDISKNTKLTYLVCSSNNLSFLDVSNNTKLIHLSVGNLLLLKRDNYNHLSSLDISKNTELTKLSCHNNPGTGATFPLTVWTTGKPTQLTILATSWNYNDKEVTIEYITKQ